MLRRITLCTAISVAAVITMFALEVAKGSATGDGYNIDTNTLLRFRALQRDLVLGAHDWWRLAANAERINRALHDCP